MTAKNIARKVVLDPGQQAQLESLTSSRSLPHALVMRARAILMAAEGMQNIDIANQVEMTRETVGKWRKRFAEFGMQGLHDELRPGRPRTVSDERVAELLNKTIETKPKNSTHWSCRTLAEETRISKASVQRIWSAFMIQPHRQSHFKLSNDPFFVEKVRDFVGLYLNPPDKAMVLCVDEKSQCQALERTQPMLPIGLGYVEGVTHDYNRHGTTTLFAASDIANSQVLASVRSDIDTRSSYSFFDILIPMSLLDSAFTL